ncbi:MAG: nucleoside 2-deoxyribosyltransferase [Candidatus Aenigmarchaeota archaeon]|nr:nucleoside 2-deoxyribosyltransferase [Candidatus Aenigmarchaeota archaeon]
MKKVYFAGSIRNDPDRNTMKELVRFIKSLGYPVLTEHVGADDPIESHAKKLGITKEEHTAEAIERSDIEWLDQATHVVAEISWESTGVGREIEYGRMKGRFGKISAEVLCLYREDREFFASPMIRGMTPDRYPNVRVSAYKNLEEAKEMIRNFLSD